MGLNYLALEDDSAYRRAERMREVEQWRLAELARPRPRSGSARVRAAAWLRSVAVRLEPAPAPCVDCFEAA